MAPAIFVQNNLVERITIPVSQFAHEHGISLLDRSVTSAFDVDDCGIDWTQHDPVIAFGSVQFLAACLKSSALGKYNLYPESSLHADVWSRQLGSRMLNAGICLPASEVTNFLESNDAHVRPNSVDKAFTAKVFALRNWEAMLAERAISPDLGCYLSPAQNILAEWRCWFVGGELVEISQYRENNRMRVEQSSDPDVARFANEVAATWLPAPCVVMDIAATDRGLRVIEFNPINSSGWYAGNVAKVFAPLVTWLSKPDGPVPG